VPVDFIGSKESTAQKYDANNTEKGITNYLSCNY